MPVTSAAQKVKATAKTCVWMVCSDMSCGEDGVPGAYHGNALHTPAVPHLILNTLRGPDPTVLNGLGLVSETTFPFSARMHRFNEDAALIIALRETGSQRQRML